jgi:hypothetical protein
MESRPLHEGLRGVLTQLGGLSLLVVLQRAATFDVETPLRQAGETLAEFDHALRALAVPGEAAHHHHHMVAASRAIGRAHALLSSANRFGSDDGARRALSATLADAADQLRFATQALPGFEMVDFTQSCCAAHRTTMPAGARERLTF